MRCWGDSGQGFLGNGDFWTTYWTPQYVNLGNQGGSAYAKETASMGHHSCTIMTDDALKCWGEAGNGQLGHGVHDGWHSNPFLAVMNGTPIEITAGFHHGCAIMDDFSVSCWGDNSYGQVGNNASGQFPLPSDQDVGYPTHIPLPPGRTAVGMSTGGLSSCVILDNGSGMCWGYHSGGRLGLGIDVDSDEPAWVNLSTNRHGYLTERDHDGDGILSICLLYTSPSPRDQRGSRMPSSA